MNAGTCTITALVSGASGSATLTVSPATLVSISLSPLDLSIGVGGVKQIIATGTFSDGTTQDITLSATFSSSNTGVATVSAAGLLQGIASGSTNVTATLGSVHVTNAVSITSATLLGVTIGPASLSLAAGSSQQMTATGTFSDGSSHDLSTSVTWSSSNTAVAAISATGVVTAITAGDATITATSGSSTTTLDMTVTPAQVVAISINPGSITLAIGQLQAFIATATFTDGTTQDVTASVHWSVANSLIGNISNSAGHAGALTGLALGNTTVSATLGSVSGSATLTVNAAVLTSISITPIGLSLSLGTSSGLIATGVYSDGSSQDLTATATWSCSNNLVLNVNSGGIALPIAVGSATVSATVNGITGSATVTISAAALTSISLSIPHLTLAAGLNEGVVAIGTYSDGSTLDITASVHWTSSNALAATVGAQGLVLALGPGATTITASLGGVNGTLALNVSSAILQTISITAPQASFALGFNLQLVATGTYSDGSTQDVTTAVQWSTDNGAIGLVSNLGIVSGFAVGQITATASLQGVTGTLPVTVNAATLVSVSIAPLNVTLLSILTHQQFTLTGHFSDGSTQVLSNGTHWSCSNTLLGLISSTGLLSPLGIGNYTVTATYGLLSATANVKIL